MKKLSILIVFLASAALLFAQGENKSSKPADTSKKEEKKTKSGGPFEKYDELKREHEALRDEVGSEDQLRISLAETMKQSLRRQHGYKDWESVAPDNIEYEQPDEKSQVYYVTHKEFAGRFRYRNDPRFYFTYPVEADVLIKPGTPVEKAPSIFAQKDGESSKPAKKDNKKKGKGQ